MPATNSAMEYSPSLMKVGRLAFTLHGMQRAAAAMVACWLHARARLHSNQRYVHCGQVCANAGASAHLGSNVAMAYARQPDVICVWLCDARLRR